MYGNKLISPHVTVQTVISGAISECLPDEIMQTCSHSNKVGRFAEIQPRLFPAEIVVCELKPDLVGKGGVVLLGAFLLFAPVRLCSWHCFMFCGCFSYFSYSFQSVLRRR